MGLTAVNRGQGAPLGPENPYTNPYAFAVRRSGRLPDPGWYQGNGTTRITQQAPVNTSPRTQTWVPLDFWLPTRNWRPRQWVSHLGARASLTNFGFPSTWFTLRLPLAVPDTQTSLARGTRIVSQKYAQLGGSGIRIPGVFVPVRPTGPGNYGGGAGP